MTFRVIYDGRGVAPDDHDFRYRGPAEDWADLCREAGRSRVEVVELPTASEEKP